jgi:RNA polymerase sigma factor (sigma-70 family)
VSAQPSVSLPPFQSLLDAHGADVHRFLTAIVGPLDADDCYQETWIAALRAYPRLRHGANLRGWLLTIAHRKAIDLIRARRRNPLALEDAVDGTRDSAMSAPADAFDGSVWQLVRRLPDKQRTALALRYVLDADYVLISSAMDTSEEAARRNVHEALSRLRREYEE